MVIFIDTKYSNIPDFQWRDYKNALSRSILLLLPLKEHQYDKINMYIDVLICRLYGANEFFKFDKDILLIIENICGAKYELNKENFDFSIYRKLVLDAYNTMKRMGGVSDV